MKFPGKRKTKHYFPVADQGRTPLQKDLLKQKNIYIVGIDQLIVDIEAHVSDEFLEEHGFIKGQSQLGQEDVIERIYRRLKKNGEIVGEFAGGSTGNTLHNYAVLADNPCIALGAINKEINVGDYAYRYICTTNSHVDLSYLKPCAGAMARAMCFITEDKERTFVISKGIMNELDESSIPKSVIEASSAFLISAYLLREMDSPICKATLKATKIAHNAGVPVVLSLGTSHIVEERAEFLNDFIKKYVTILAGNEQEFSILTKSEDPLVALDKMLDYCDLVLETVGESGLYMGGHCESELLRKTKDQIHSKSIASYNKYEYSRAMLKKSCRSPQKIYTHINPFMGGPGKIENTNGAGDAALSALLHDLSANDHHRDLVPSSPKHMAQFLTYSSLHQVAKYANRASFEVLNQNSPRLSKGLPEREDSLEEDYWEN